MIEATALGGQVRHYRFEFDFGFKSKRTVQSNSGASRHWFIGFIDCDRLWLSVHAVRCYTAGKGSRALHWAMRQLLSRVIAFWCMVDSRVLNLQISISRIRVNTVLVSASISSTGGVGTILA